MNEDNIIFSDVSVDAVVSKGGGMFMRWVKVLSMLAVAVGCMMMAGRAQATVIDFDDLPVGVDAIAAHGQSIPAHAQLSDQYVSTYGVRFYSSNTFVAVVDLKSSSQAPSAPNGIGGSTMDGILDYNNICARFYDPAHPSQPAVTDYVSVTADLWGNSSIGPGFTVTLNAYDVDGTLIDSHTADDTGGEILHVSAPGIHSVQFLCNKSQDAAIDNFTFNELKPAPERKQIVHINFDDFAVGMHPYGSNPVPEESRLSDQYLSQYGVSFYSSSPYVAVVNLDIGSQAPSSPNGVGGTTADGVLVYNNICARFFDPARPQKPGVTDYVAVTADKWGASGYGPGYTVTLNAYDVQGTLVDSCTAEDVGGEILQVSAPGIHSVQFLCNKSFDAAIDNFTFHKVRPACGSITSINPRHGKNHGFVNIELAGHGFAHGSMVTLVRKGQKDIRAAKTVVIDEDTIICDFDLTNKTSGYWNIMVSTGDTVSELAAAFEIKQSPHMTYPHAFNAPNPFSPAQGTQIVFDMPEDGSAELRLYTESGDLCWHRSFEGLAAGQNQIAYNGRDDNGRPLYNGTYVCEITCKYSGGESKDRCRLLIVK